MTDRTSQPADGIGVHSAYSANARFLWNGIAPNVNQLTLATGTGAKGTSISATPGTYQRFNNTDGAITFSGITVPTGAYTLVLVAAYPQASQSSAGRIFSTPNGGMRNEGVTGPTAVTQALVHTGVASANTLAKADGFDDDIWVYIARYNGTTLNQAVRAPDGTTTTDSQTISYSAGTANSVQLGSALGSPCMGGLYAVLLTANDIGSTEATAIMDNPWRLFAEEAAADTTAPTLTSPTGAGGLAVCSGTVSTDEGNGTLYAVATASATAPTALQVRNGQDHTGAAALRVVSQAVSATGVQTVASGAITGGAGTRYLHYMHEDAAGNRSAVVSSAGFSVTANATKIDLTIAAAAGLTGIRWAIFGASTIAGSASIIASGSAESVDGAGLISLDITGLGIAVGAVRYVVLTQSNGDPAQSPVPYGWHGPATAS